MFHGTQQNILFEFILALLSKSVLFLTDEVQEKLNMWLLKTQKFLNEVASPLVRPSQIRNPVPEDALDDSVMEDIVVEEQTINARTPQGILSLAAIVSIEQFSRWNNVSVTAIALESGFVFLSFFKSKLGEMCHDNICLKKKKKDTKTW